YDECVVLVELIVLNSSAYLQVLNSFRVNHIGTQTCVGEAPILTDRCRLDRTEICEGVFARVVVELIAPDECADRKYCVRIEQASPRWRDIEGLDLGTLVGASHRVTGWISRTNIEIVK